MNNKIKYLILIIAITLVTLISSSYALLRNSSRGTNTYTMNVGNLEVNFVDQNTSNIQISNMYPMSDEEGLALNGEHDILTFTIFNNGSMNANYDVYIDELDTSDNIASGIKFAYSTDNGVNYSTPKLVGTDNYIEKSGVLETNQTKTYKVKMWLDYNADSSYMNKVFKARIVVESSQHSNHYYGAIETLESIKSKVVGYEGLYYFDNNGDLDYGDGTKISLNLDKEIPKGNVSIWNNQIIYACFNYGDYNYEYSYNQTTKVRELTERNIPCIIDRYQNLVINGDLSYKSNLNLEEFGEYNQEGYLRVTGNSRVDSYLSDYVSIDVDKKYEIVINIKSSNTNAKYFVGFAEYDADKKYISAHHYLYIENTLTELTENLIPGQTEVHLNNLSNWNNTTTANFQKGFIFWNYKDSTGYQYPELTYSQNARWNLWTNNDVIDKTNNIITLSSPWPESFGTIPAGTKVSQPSDGNTFNYSVLSENITTNFEIYKTVSPITKIYYNGYRQNKFRPGCKFIKIFIAFNYNNIPNTTTDIKNIYIREVNE